jgi:hypothetical protein
MQNHPARDAGRTARAGKLAERHDRDGETHAQ